MEGDPSEIPCLVTGLPASGAILMKNSAYNGGVQDSFWIIPWEVVLEWKDGTWNSNFNWHRRDNCPINRHLSAVRR